MSSVYGSSNIQNSASVQNSVQNPVAAPVASTIESTHAPSVSADSHAFIGDRAGMEAYLRQEFSDDNPFLVDIARCESNFAEFDANGNVVRGIVNKDDVGVMQINEKIHGAMAKKLGLDLHTTDGNIEYAKHLYREQGATPWFFSSKCWAGQDLAIRK